MNEQVQEAEKIPEWLEKTLIDINRNMLRGGEATLHVFLALVDMFGGYSVGEKTVVNQDWFNLEESKKIIHIGDILSKFLYEKKVATLQRRIQDNRFNQKRKSFNVYKFI